MQAITGVICTFQKKVDISYSMDRSIGTEILIAEEFYHIFPTAGNIRCVYTSIPKDGLECIRDGVHFNATG